MLKAELHRFFYAELLEVIDAWGRMRRFERLRAGADQSGRHHRGARARARGCNRLGQYRGGKCTRLPFR
jgi:hypothetical protein